MAKNTKGGSTPSSSKPISVATEKGVRGTFGATPTRPVDVKKGGKK